mgnify:CR=1 FL=1
MKKILLLMLIVFVLAALGCAGMNTKTDTSLRDAEYIMTTAESYASTVNALIEAYCTAGNKDCSNYQAKYTEVKATYDTLKSTFETSYNSSTWYSGVTNLIVSLLGLGFKFGFLG